MYKHKTESSNSINKKKTILLELVNNRRIEIQFATQIAWTLNWDIAIFFHAPTFKDTARSLLDLVQLRRKRNTENFHFLSFSTTSRNCQGYFSAILFSGKQSVLHSSSITCQWLSTIYLNCLRTLSHCENEVYCQSIRFLLEIYATNSRVAT